MTSHTITPVSGAMLVILAAIWGSSFVFVEVALREVPPLTITLHRLIWALPILALVVRLCRIPLPRNPRIWGAYLVMGGLNNALPFSLITLGQTRIEAGLTSILLGITAVFGALAAGILLRDEPLTMPKIAGACLGLAGVAIVMGPSALHAWDPRDLAQLAIIGAALCYALAGCWARIHLSGQPLQMNALGMVGGGTLMMIPVVLTVEGVPQIALSPGTWAALLSLAIVSTSLAYLLYFAILSRVGSGNLMLVTLLIPPFAVGLGALFLGEALGASALAGFAVIALGIIVTDGRALRQLRR